jgi:hypothetical protein
LAAQDPILSRIGVSGKPGAVHFESDGEMLGVLPEHAPIPLTFLPDNRLLAASQRGAVVE